MSAENGVACGGICAAAHGNDSKKATTVAGIALIRSFTSLSLYGFGWTTERSRQQCTLRRVAGRFDVTIASFWTFCKGILLAMPTSIMKDPVTWLYPPIEPYNTGRLQVSPIHEIYFE